MADSVKEKTPRRLEEHFLHHAEETEGNKLYNKKQFFKKVEVVLKNSSHDSQWCMLAIDIENLKLFNEWYGRKAGDELLDGVSECLKNNVDEPQKVAGYFGDDDFALLMEYDKERIQQVYKDISNLLDSCSNKTGFLPAIGIYEITDKTESVYAMYDRAELARTTVKGNYTVRMKLFDAGMLEKLESNYVLFSDVRKALQDKSFTFYLQPKCNMENGKVIGAEALVRWISKDKGMISPGVFIPFLEKTGFIAELDPYIWEEVCKWQRKQLDLGIKTVPISVNVSRVDMYSLDVPAFFCEMIQKYDLEPKLIEIEITESTYTEDNAFINATIAQLRKAGFRVLMDDFGSGYSSLNMLKDVEVDVLKIDMRFLDINAKNATRGISILEAVINMASLLGIDTIIEGVETEEQKEFLLKMSCGYAQGYYFYRPLPQREFEEVISNSDNLDYEGYRDKKIDRFYLKDLLSEDMFNETMINNMLGAVIFYDLYEGQITVRRYNERFEELLGSTGRTPDIDVDCRKRFLDKDYQKMLEMFKKARGNRYDGAEGDVCRQFADGHQMWLHLRIFFIKEQEGHQIYYSSVEDVSEVYKKNAVLKQQNAELQFLNNDMPGGYYRHKNNEDGDFIYISKRFLDIFGFTREEIKEQFDDKFINMIHPDDRVRFWEGIAALGQTGGNYSQPCRMRSRNGYIMVTDQSRLVQYDGREFFQGMILCDLDYYRHLLDENYVIEENEAASDVSDEVAYFMPCGVFKYEADGNQEFVYVSDSMLEMLGYTRQGFAEKFKNQFPNMIYEEDRDRVAQEIKEQVSQDGFDSCEYRIEMADGSLKWVYDRGRLVTDENGKRWFYVVVVDYSYLKEKYREKEWQQEKYKTLSEIQGMIVFDYEPHLDRMTLEISRKDGRIESLVFDGFAKNLDSYDWLSQEEIDNQRNLLKEALRRSMSGAIEMRARLTTDKEQWYRTHFKSLADENGKVYRVVGRADNIENEIQTLLDWKERAMSDSLTGLLNSDSAKMILNEMAQDSAGGTLFLIDVDNFREFNEKLGVEWGDEFLKNVAEIIRATFRKDDVLSRYGGDEFLMYAPGSVNRKLLHSE